MSHRVIYAGACAHVARSIIGVRKFLMYCATDTHIMAKYGVTVRLVSTH